MKEKTNLDFKMFMNQHDILETFSHLTKLSKENDIPIELALEIMKANAMTNIYYCLEDIIDYFHDTWGMLIKKEIIYGNKNVTPGNMG